MHTYTGWFFYWNPPISVPKRKPCISKISEKISLRLIIKDLDQPLQRWWSWCRTAWGRCPTPPRPQQRCRWSQQSPLPGESCMRWISLWRTYKTRESLGNPILKQCISKCIYVLIKPYISRGCSPSTIIPNGIWVCVSLLIAPNQDQLGPNGKSRPKNVSNKNWLHIATENCLLPR